MSFESWVLVIGGVLLGMGLTARYVISLPFTATMVYLGIGILLGPAGWAVLNLDPNVRVDLFHRCAEVAVVISLFTVGLKLRLPWRDKRWSPPLVLAFGSMAVTVGLITVVAAWALKLPWGAAILLGAILAPTDPVLASDVQMRHPGDRDELRLALSGEAGFNDGTPGQSSALLAVKAWVFHGEDVRAGQRASCSKPALIRLRRAPTQARAVRSLMSIDKESNGIPEVNVHRPTTRVNLWMIAGIVMFLVVGAAAAFVIARQAASPTGAPLSATGKN